MLQPFKKYASRLLSLAASIAVLSPLGAQAAKAVPAAPPPTAPLASVAGQRIVVLPVQLLAADTGAFVEVASWATWRVALDDSIGAAIAGRGVGKGWAYAADVARQAKRNATFAADPYLLGAQSIRRAEFKAGDAIPDLLASNLRPAIALGNARYALLPVELRIERQDGKQRARLRLLLIDVRAATILWSGLVTGDPVTAPGPELLGSLTRKVADLVVPER